MQPEDPSPSVNPSIRALGFVVEALLATVPPALLESIVVHGMQCPEAAAWRQGMGCNVITDKVQRALRRVYDERDVAAQSLRKVCYRSPSSRASCSVLLNAVDWKVHYTQAAICVQADLRDFGKPSTAFAPPALIASTPCGSESLRIEL